MPTAVAIKPNEAKHIDFTHSLSPDQLKQAMALEADRRKIIRDFVRSQLEQDKDYGSIQVRSRSGAVSQSKPVLFKSGMEKVFSLFNVVSTLEKDTETIEMVAKPGVIAYKCTLSRNGQFIGEGRGACDISEKVRVNDAIKIAEKRARMDACLNLGFSEYFTQDLEDLPSDQLEDESKSEQKPAPSASPASVSAPKPTWRNGEVREITFMVKEKEMKSAQNGTVYAVLYTDQGTIKAWKNTYSYFNPGHTYTAAVEGSEWNGVVSLSVARILQEETEESSPS